MLSMLKSGNDKNHAGVERHELVDLEIGIAKQSNVKESKSK